MSTIIQNADGSYTIERRKVFESSHGVPAIKLITRAVDIGNYFSVTVSKDGKTITLRRTK